MRKDASREGSDSGSGGLGAQDDALRSESLGELGFMLSAALAIACVLEIGGGDPWALRLELASLWAGGALLAELLRRKGSLDAAAWSLGWGGWASLSAAQWLSGGLSSSGAGGAALMAMASGTVGGWRLAASLAAGTALDAVAMWAAAGGGWAPVQLLGYAPDANFVAQAAMAAVAGIGAGAALRRMGRAARAARVQEEKADDAAENFMGLFLQSPAAMALSEASRRRGPGGPRLLAVNEAFERMFDTGSKSSWGTPKSHADLWMDPDEFQSCSKRLAAEGALTGVKSYMVSWGRKRKMVCLASARPSMWNGSGAMLWTFQDVTDSEVMRVRLQRQNEALSEKAAAGSLEARMDLLTKLPNRRALDERMALIDQSGEDIPFCAMMIDVDFFKKYNDGLGHQAGDDCLAKVGSALAEAAAEIGQGAFAARYGGEEFAMALSGFGEAEAMAAAWTVVDKVLALRIPHPNSSAGSAVSVSVGVSSKGSGTTGDALRGADKALYRSKEEGRARASWEPPESP